jgi:uncharacterized membrane protein YagU involved in acid resistance
VTDQNHLIKGAVAGFLATIPMTLAMRELHRRLPSKERYPLPPRLITEQVLGPRTLRSLTEPQRVGTTLAAHFGYGALTGALYPLIARRSGRGETMAGIVFGVGVWAASYLGWIPASGVLTPATEHPARRNLLMLASHLVWGASTALIYRAFARQGRMERMLTSRRAPRLASEERLRRSPQSSFSADRWRESRHGWRRLA